MSIIHATWNHYYVVDDDSVSLDDVEDYEIDGGSTISNFPNDGRR